MSRAGCFLALAIVTAAATLLGGLFVVGPAAASPQPVPVCSVCGQTFHENVTETTATLQVTEAGDIEWRVENELAEPTASKWRDDPDAAERQYREAVEYGSPIPSEPSDHSIGVTEDGVVLEFVDREVARHRLGLLVVPYFHGEGSVYRWVVNADELAVVAPDGYRVVNEPAGADVEGDRVIWRGDIGGSSPRDVSSAAPEPGDTYVVVGSGFTADQRSTVVTPLLPLDSTVYGAYGIGLLFVVGLAFGIYTIQGTRLGPGRVSAGLGTVGLPDPVPVGLAHPPTLAGLAGLFVIVYWMLLTVALGLVGGATLYGVAAAAEGPTAGESK